jgi:hypothetical protein
MSTPPEETRNWSTLLKLVVNDVTLPAQSVDYTSEKTLTPIDVLHARNTGFFESPIRATLTSTVLQIGGEASALLGELHGKGEWVKAEILPTGESKDEWSFSSLVFHNAKIGRVEATGHGPGEVPTITFTMSILRVTVTKSDGTSITYGA